MKRLLTFLVVLALIGYLSFKGAVWWLADQRLADAQEPARSMDALRDIQNTESRLCEDVDEWETRIKLLKHERRKEERWAL